MIRLFLLLTIILVLILFVLELKKYLTRDTKLEEFREVKIHGDVIDINNDIAVEKARQKDVNAKTKKINL